MTKLMNLLATATLSLALCAPLSVQAQPASPNGPAPNVGAGPMSLYQEAGASPEQQKQIAAAAKDFEELANNGHKRLMAIQQRMDELTLQPMPDEKQVMKNQDELNKLICELNNARAKMMIKARSILTPEQRDKVVQIIKKHRAEHSHG